MLRKRLTSISDYNQADIIEASTSRNEGDLLNIENPYFKGMVNHINPPDTESPFLDLHLFFSNDFVSFNIYDKRNDLF